MEPIVTLYEREATPATTLPDELAAVYGGGLLLPEGHPTRARRHRSSHRRAGSTEPPAGRSPSAAEPLRNRKG